MGDHHGQVLEKVQNNAVGALEKLRLVLLFALRYEHQAQEIHSLKDALRHAGISEEQVQLVDHILMYGGSHARQEDLFQNKSALAMVKSSLANLQGVDNVYTQHKSLLSSTTDALLKGRLSESRYPCCNQNGSRPLENCVVFMVGGTTYEEARDLAQLSTSQQRIVLGGTTIHNSRTFLADVAQLVRLQNAPRGLD